MSNRPFSGVRVLDLTHVLAGPFCTYQLALLGADVIKIERPGEPDVARGRGPARQLARQGLGLNFQVQGGGKRALALDLADPRGRDLFLELVDTADVVVENYRRGGLDALGLGADALCARNPRLIHCAISGFGEGGPWADWRAYDNVIQAASGMMAATGRSGPPVKTAASVVDYATGMTAAFAIAAALVQRQVTGTGQRIDCAMLDIALMFQAPELAAAAWPDEAEAIPREAGLATYAAADGPLMLGAFTPRQNARLWRHLGRPELADTADWDALWAASDAIRDALTQLLPTRPAADWEAELNAIGVPAQRVRTPKEALALPHVRERGFVQLDEDGVLAPTTPFRLAHDGARLDRPPPRVGEHSAELLSELGLRGDRIAELARDGVIACG